MAAADWPSTEFGSLQIVSSARSRCSAPVSVDATTETTSSTVIACSEGGRVSAPETIPGRYACKKIGRSGGECECRGVVRMNVARRLEASISPTAAAAISSFQSTERKRAGVVASKQRSRSNAGALSARAAAKALRIACVA